MAVAYPDWISETPTRVLSAALQEARAELRETRARLRETERELAHLTARYRALSAERLGPTITLASGAIIDPDQRTATRDGRTVSFSQREWALVELLLAARRPRDKATLADALWTGACGQNSIASLVARVRDRLGQIGADGDLCNRSRQWTSAWYELRLAS